MSSEEVVFSRDQFDTIENDSDASLRVLSNCVNLVNCTILRERRLLPDDYFSPFRVYGDVYGYMLRKEHSHAEKVAKKLNSMSEAIRQKRIYKLALLIEEDLNTRPVEAFVWNFCYDGKEINARIGHKGKNTKIFQVMAHDMERTCRSFCELFSNLQSILNELRPLTSGMIPSLRAAYIEDPEYVIGFHPVEEFPKVSRIDLRTVEFPHNHKINLSYASDFIYKDRNQNAEQDNIEDQTLVDEFASPQIEVTRRRTLGCTGTRDEHHPDFLYGESLLRNET